MFRYLLELKDPVARRRWARLFTKQSPTISARRGRPTAIFRAGIKTPLGDHTFRATGITAYLKNSGKLEVAQHIANHESPRTTKLLLKTPARRTISLDEVARIAI